MRSNITFDVACFTVVFLIYTIVVAWLIARISFRKKESVRLKEQIEENEVYLKYLQVKPHFVYNTLNTIYILIEEDPERAQRMLYKLSKYLQRNVQIAEKKGLIPFSEAVQYLEFYFDIMKEKFALLEIEYQLDAVDFYFPPFVLQPIVENAIVHGFRYADRKGKIVVHSEYQGERVIVTIEDNGEGIKDDSKPSGIALNNIRRRIELLLNGTIEMEMVPGKGTRVVLNVERREA